MDISIVIAIALIVLSVALTVLVVMQSGKDKSLSGSISGASETFFGKTGSASNDKKLSTITTVLAIVFAVLVLVAYLVLPVIA